MPKYWLKVFEDICFSNKVLLLLTFFDKISELRLDSFISIKSFSLKTKFGYIRLRY